MVMYFIVIDQEYPPSNQVAGLCEHGAHSCLDLILRFIAKWMRHSVDNEVR